MGRRLSRQGPGITPAGAEPGERAPRRHAPMAQVLEEAADDLLLLEDRLRIGARGPRGSEESLERPRAHLAPGRVPALAGELGEAVEDTSVVSGGAGGDSALEVEGPALDLLAQCGGHRGCLP